MTNHKHTKRALLSSMVSLMLCFAMLLGTTFAWFTDTASTSVNKIQAGTLKVDIVDTNRASLQGNSLTFQGKNGENLWEPGVTFNTNKFMIENKGNLALKYQIILNGANGDAELLNVIDFKICKDDGTAVDLNNFEGTLISEQVSEAFYITGTMKKEAGNGYQGKSLEGIGITVVATQWTYESDSNGNDYDNDAAYSTADANTTAMLITDGNLTINKNLSIDSSKTNGNSDVIRITGGDHVITGGNYTAYGTKSNSCLRVDGGNVTIKDGNFEVKEDNNCIYAAGGNITIEGGTFKSEKEYDGHYWVLNVKDNSGSVITVKGGRFYKFDPSNANTGNGEIVVADGYKVVQDGDWYEVVAENPITSEKELKNIAAGSTVVLMDDITLNAGVTLADNVTILGNENTISGAAVTLGNNVVVKDVIFDAPKNNNNNASNVVAHGSVTFDGCTFKNTQWDSIQVAGELDGKAVIINNCTFETAIDGAARFIHIEVSNGSACTAKTNVVLTKNTFGSSEKLTAPNNMNDIIGIYGVDESYINYGGNNTFADINGTVYIGWSTNTYASNQSAVYNKLTGK